MRCQETSTGHGLGRLAVIAFAGLALLLQQLAVPLHLTWHEHHAPAGLATHAHPHAHGAHAHAGHDHAPAPHESPHEPHPLDEHRDETTATTAPRAASVTGELALALPCLEILLGDASSVALPQEVEPSPRPPPRVRATAPRGPPFAV